MKKNIVFIICLFFCVLLTYSPVFSAESGPSNIYVVKTGDTISKVAERFDTTVDELIITNGLQSNTLLAGQKLWVPVTYEVVVGDTLKDIAITHNSSIELIKTINGLSSEELYTGQIIKIVPQKMTMQGQHILMTREEFKDWLFHNEFNRPITKIQQHHTWVPSYKHFDGSNHFRMLSGMENHHINKMGWSNIAQNITTFPDGKIAVSRPFNVAPEGSIGATANTGALSIEHVGNFDIGNDVMTEQQKETIVYINALLCIKFGLSPSIDSITYHHWWDLKTGEKVLDNGPDYNVKTCPGTGFFGGNSTSSAKKYFYPLISGKIDEVLASME
ncbi:LysM peptidoglycan-binding domain-containing protein [Bacillus sp. FJAT-45350]|uniref:LysM peptidoglycan-binding domain-containing protein n=1 Tax=Bacillus sp. FJAT-45350 TaxID=2011014 RepID=UPI000BB96D23|nr:LysM peptidoglycan-binding domain-containing protein [Bacillus sp. FJAT-45350]